MFKTGGADERDEHAAAFSKGLILPDIGPDSVS
jgi:hypothetical protein